MENKYKLNIYPKAQLDIEGIVNYIANVLLNPIAATDFINDLKSGFETVCIFPECCPLINNDMVKDKTLRKLLVKNYIAFYRVRSNEIQVVRVLYGMSNYQSIL